jgi:hypothetical protein
VGKRVPELVQELVGELGTVLGVTRHVGDELWIRLALAHNQWTAVNPYERRSYLIPE